MRIGLVLFIWALLSWPLVAQDTMTQDVVYPHHRQGDLGNLAIDRADVLRDSTVDVHTAVRRYTVAHNDSLNLRKGWISTFYKDPNHLYSISTKDFSLGLNVYFDLRFGRDLSTDQNIFLNKRGIELFGSLDNKLYFYSAYEENQSNFLEYRLPLIDNYGAIRSRGNYKPYTSSILDGVEGFDYGFATAYLGYKLSKHARLELGHSRHFIGNGIRSLLLSDETNNYFNVRLEAKFWKVHYQSIFAELSSISARFNRGNQLLPKKYMVNHYLSVKPFKNMEVGIFEAIVFSRENQFELQYLNPVIFYRTLEHQLDSPDNVLLGVNGKWNLFKHVSLYGQFLLDEFRFNQFFSGEGWWGNKFALQLGLKYYDVLGLANLDMQIEYNRVRPFTYTHWQQLEGFEELTVSNYSHFNQSLAHPLGANFTEFIFQVRYRPTPRLSTALRYVSANQGRTLEFNAGEDVLLDNGTRSSDFGQNQNQGLLTSINILRLQFSYELTRKLYWDVELLMRNESNTETDLSSQYIGTGLRYNISQTTVDY